MKATFVHVRDAFRPQVNRDIRAIRNRIRIETLLRQQGLITGRGKSAHKSTNFVVKASGEDYLLESEWRRCVKDGEVITVINVPAGGGALRTLAMVAVTVVAAWVTGGAGGAIASGFWSSAAGAATALAGSILGSPLLPKEAHA